MNNRKLLKLIYFLSSNQEESSSIINSDDIHKLWSQNADQDNLQNNLYRLVQNLYNDGFINMEGGEQNFKVELTAKGIAYLLSS